GPVEVATVPTGAMLALTADFPLIARALLIESLVDVMIQREWTVNVGRRDARTRLAHLICEIALRSEASGLGTTGAFTMPLTQEQIGDAAALTAVHVNRVLQQLRRDVHIAKEGRVVTIPDWDALAEAGQFHPDYLRPVLGASVEHSR